VRKHSLAATSPLTAPISRVLLAAIASLLTALGLLSVGAVYASAAPPTLWESCDSASPSGRQCLLPRGVASDPKSGHIFVADQGNHRTVELDALGEFIRAWGGDVVAAGPSNISTAPEPPQSEICVPAEGDTCKEGASGIDAGQMNNPLGVALDSAGSVYVVDFSNLRIQKFDRRGNFLLMFGGEVNKTTKADVCTAADIENGDECGAGTTGTGSGEFGSWAVGSFIAVDTNGTEAAVDDKVYVGDQNRIQWFDVNGLYQGEFAVAGTVQSLAIDPSGNLYVGFGDNKVHKLGPVGEPLSPTFELPKPDPFTDRTVTAVAVDSRNHVYVFADPDVGNKFVPLNRIYEFDTAGNIVDEFGEAEFSSSYGLATGFCAGSEPPGNLYVANFGANNFVRAYGTEPVGCFKARTLPATNLTETSARLNGTINPNGSLTSECRFEWGVSTAYGNVAPCVQSSAVIGEGAMPVPVHADVAGLAAGTIYHFRLRARISGETETGPDVAFKTKGPPVISDQHVVGTTATTATVRAVVNPEGFLTSCRVDYGLTDTYGQSTASVVVGDDRGDHATTVVISGLAERTSYHWRFVCDNTAVLDGGTTEGSDRTFVTHADGPLLPCPNDEVRYGTSGSLPDCRAYEMVSPIDKNGADIVGGRRIEGEDVGNYVQVSPDGDRITYASLFPAFCDSVNSFTMNQYLAVRDESEPRQVGDGWSCEALHPPYEGRRLPGKAPGVFRDFIVFTPDLCSAWLVDLQTPALTEEGQDEAANLYRRNNCEPGVGALEALTDVEVPLIGEARADYVDQFSVQGVSDDGRHAIFVANAKLTLDAALGTNAQLYDRFEGGLHLVSVLPSGAADTGNAAVGGGWQGNLDNAVAVDGSTVYWTSGIDNNGVGKIFVRVHPEQGKLSPGEECSASDKACTIAVSKGTSNPFADDLFWAASPDGAKALYSEGNLGNGEADLYVFDLATKTSQKVAQNVMGVAGASEDLSRIYFVSRKALAGAGENSEEEAAVEGEPNLYLLDGGVFEFVATLEEGDVGAREPGTFTVAYDLDNRNTLQRSIRITPDGSKLAFNSRAALTEFDNAAAGGKPAVEVYTYDAGADELLCISCNPSGARPVTRELPEPYRPPGTGRETQVLAAAWIPTWEHPLHASNVLSENGQRLFFNSNDALLPRDTNGAQDVYEWEAVGAGSCDEGGSNFFPGNGGCLYLISSGRPVGEEGGSSFESEFWEASPDGDDVFFTTDASLLPQDPGSVDLYDARVGGGFPQPPPPTECDPEAEDCRNPGPPPEFTKPPTSVPGPGNGAPGRDCRPLAKRAKKLSTAAKRARRAAKQSEAKALDRKAARKTDAARKANRKAGRCRRASGGEGR
jgi:NHL repeat